MQAARARRLSPHLPRLKDAKIAEELAIRFVPFFDHRGSVIATPWIDKEQILFVVLKFVFSRHTIYIDSDCSVGTR